MNTEEKIVLYDTKEYITNSLDSNKTEAQTFKLVAETDPILKEVMSEFDFKNPPMNPNTLASCLVETCKENKGKIRRAHV